jgi:hypothetical protein
MTLTAPAVPTCGAYRAFRRYAVSYWPTPDHRERVEVQIPVFCDGPYSEAWTESAKAAALQRGAMVLGRPADECCIGYLTTITRRIDE